MIARAVSGAAAGDDGLMGISTYLADLRRHVGTGLLLHPGVSALVRDDGGRLLLERRSDSGQWSLPGGAIDPGEAPAQALVREVHEETGLVVRPVRLVGVVGPQLIVYPHGDRLEVTTSVFVCDVVGGELVALDGESLELRFVDVEHLPVSTFLAPYRFEALLTGSSGAWFAWDEAWLPAGSATEPAQPRGA